MGTDPAVSVIIPCFRACGFLGLQLESLAHQEQAPPFEVVLVDNGENEQLEHLARLWPQLDTRIVDATAQRGAGYARNVGMISARADFLMFCDADDVVMPNWVRLGYDQLQRTDVFSGGAVPVAEEAFERGWAAVVRSVKVRPQRADLPWSGSPNYPILMGGSFGIRRDLALGLGGFDLSFGSAAEDNDLAHRIAATGRKLPDASHVCIAYRIRGLSASFRRGFRAGVSHALLAARHNLWRTSPAYAGRWPLRPVRSLTAAGAALVGGQEAWHGQWRDELGRQVGVVVGWVRFRHGLGIPREDMIETATCRYPSREEHAGRGVDASVIIPCYNAAGTIGRQLRALADQEGAPDFEVICVLNGCTDDTEAVVARFAKAHPAMVIRIEHSAKGRCVARNHGAIAARGDVLAFCDADDTVFPDWLAHHFARTSQLHGIVGGSVVHKFVNPPEVLAVYGIDPDEIDPAELEDLPLDDLSKPRAAAEGNFSAWREDYLAIGGMDASFRGGLEGDDLCLRAWMAGIPVNSCVLARIHYWLRATPASSFSQQRGLARGKMLFFVRHYHTGHSAGASFRYSLLGTFTHLLRAPLAFRGSPEDLQRFLHAFGGHVGSLEGHILYRVLRKVPEPQLISASGGRGTRGTLRCGFTERTPYNQRDQRS